ncbi:MAG TPA: DUF5753 domain-containing protein [Micromonospora sp.]
MSPLEFLLRELRRRRAAAGLTQGALGERIHFSDTHISAVETGARPPTREFLRAVDETLSTGGLLADMWDELVKDGVTPVWLREWIEIEREAAALRWFEPAWVPGLLQVEEYARATLAAEMLTADEVDQLVAARMGRQSVLTAERPPLLVAVIDEAVIRRLAHGSSALAVKQLDHLVDCAEMPNVELHIVPSTTGLYPGLGGQFILAETRGGARVAYADSQLSAQILDRPEEIATLAGRWERVRSCSLPGPASVATIKEAASTCGT